MFNFEVNEEKLRFFIEFGEGLNKRQGFNSYVLKIVLYIFDFGGIEVMGDSRADKKSF